MRSGLLRQHRRYFAVAAFGLLATPLVVGVVRPDSPAAILKEGRYVTPAPQAPVDGEGWLKLPKDVDAYLQDHFGLREKMIRLHKDVTKPLVFKENNVAINGDSGRFYAIADGMVLQSAGRVFRQQRVADAAELIVTMRDALRKRGIAFLVALPPNSSTVYPDDLPYWARNPGKKTEYDALLETIEAQGVRAVDLRPALVPLASTAPPILSTICTGMFAELSPASTQLSTPTADRTGISIRHPRSGHWPSAEGGISQRFSALRTVSAKPRRPSPCLRRERRSPCRMARKDVSGRRRI